MENEAKDEGFEPFDASFADFYDLVGNYNVSDKANKATVELNTTLYHLNKKKYSRDSRELSAKQLETLIKLRNSGVPSVAIANSLKIQVVALAKIIKNAGFKWSVSLKRYVQKEDVPKKIKKRLIERTKISSLTVEPHIYRIIALKAYLENLTYAQVISAAIIAGCSKEIYDLSVKPSSQLKFHKLRRRM